MFNNNLQAAKLNKPVEFQPANGNKTLKAGHSASLLTFKGTAYSPLRDEYFTVKIDDEVYTKKNKKDNSKGLLGLLKRIFHKSTDAIIKAYDDPYQVKTETSNPYSISYYA